ncbi:MAG: zinc-ribbon domain-containing protein [Desulfotomaculaceae bacterium]|nr:zinc-ribbon domain-containing protein [Desulfotomaculaceae bacterium]
MNCPNCQKALQEDAKFCPHCGTAITQNRHCPSCGKKTDPSWVFCPGCGASLKGVPNQNIPAQPPQPPSQNYPQNPNQPHYSHGQYYGSSSRKHRRKGFLGRIFSS